MIGLDELLGQRFFLGRAASNSNQDHECYQVGDQKGWTLRGRFSEIQKPQSGYAQEDCASARYRQSYSTLDDPPE